jgi:hypothetical protein
MADGTEITDTALMRIQNFMTAKRLPDRLRVLVPVNTA